MKVQTTELTCLSCFAPLKEPKGVCPRCGCDNAKVQNESHQIECGSILAGTYLVGKVLGQGGFGITYVGWDLNLDIKVAIKEYYPEGCVTRDTHTHVTVLTYAGAKEAFFQKGKERFVEEARALARFSGDSGVVGVRSFFYENGTAYIVMDYVEGETLKSYAAHRGGKLPAAEVLALFRPLIRSLARVHDNGLLHRDISPDNIMLRPDGTLALLDFGAARQMSVTGERSNTINVKHGYAPEEQYRTRGEQGPWTDVYALCATIYRLTAGATPPEALDRMANDEPLTPPNDLGADFTPSQQEAILHGLALRASARTRDLRILAAELYDNAAPAQAPQTAIVPPTAPTAPVTDVGTQPISRGVEPEVPSKVAAAPLSKEVKPAAPATDFVTQPLSQEAGFAAKPQQPEQAASAIKKTGAAAKKPAAAENADAQKVISTEPQIDAAGASVQPEEPSAAEAKRKKTILIRCYAAYTVFAVMLLFFLIGLSQGFGAIAFYPILAVVGIVLLGFLFKKNNARYLNRTNRISSAIILTLNLLVAVAFAVIIGTMYLPYSCAVPADTSYASPTEAPSASTNVDMNAVIDFQDPIIETGVRNALGKTNGEAITVGDVAYITNIHIVGDNFVVNDYDFWPYVDYYGQQYSVDGGQTWQAFPGYTVSLKDLSNFTNLKTLNVMAVTITDNAYLRYCQNLVDVTFDACGNINFTMFDGLLYLTSISVADCDTVLLIGANVEALHSLWLNNCGPISGSNVAAYENLNTLSIGGQISELDSLGLLGNLWDLSIYSSQVTSLSFLRRLPGLTTLNLSCENVQDIEPIGTLTNLQYLTLQNLPVSDLSSLGNLTDMQAFSIYYMPVSDIRVLSNMRNLSIFQCFGTNVKDFSPLEGLPMQYIYVEAKDESTLKQMFPTADVYGF